MADLHSNLPESITPATFDALPDLPAIGELKSRRQWVSWKYENRGGTKPTKPPIAPRTGFGASHSKPETWGSYDEAVTRTQRSRLEGVGYVLSPDDGLTGADLDNCYDPQSGCIDAWAQAIIDLHETYAEFSPSGTGLRIIWRGKVEKAIKADAVNVEVYGTQRYLTITGWHLGGFTPKDIRPAPKTLALLQARVLAAKPVAPPTMLPAKIEPVHALPVPSGDRFFRDINTAALASLSTWVPALYPSARLQPGTGAYRVSSRALGRNLQEDLSISPEGIVDFGVADMGDAREGKRTPITLHMEVEGGDAKFAAFWLCDRMGRTPESFGWHERDHRELVEVDGILKDAASGEEVEPETVTPTTKIRKLAIEATPFEWQDPKTIPMRQWVYGGHYIRKFISLTLAPGGVGKSSLTMVEALAMVTNEPILGVKPDGRSNVWLWNGEDPLEEMQRRMTAAMMYHNCDPDEVHGRLFMNSGRQTEIILATENRQTGTIIAVPVVDAVMEAIRLNGIDCMIIDPFVSSHRVSENDNNAIDRVAKTWAKIADECNCSIELVHHVRKSNGGEVTVDDGRGASALLAASRSARVLNQMTDDEAAEAGVKPARAYFRMDNGKSNLAPPPDHSSWFKMIGVPLPNGYFGFHGDNVGVVDRWRWPDHARSVTTDVVAKMQDAVAANMACRLDPRAENWVGETVAQVMDIDISEPAERKKVIGMVKKWVDSGVLKIKERPDGKRMMKEFVEVGKRVQVVQNDLD